MLVVVVLAASLAQADGPYMRQETWAASLLATRQELKGAKPDAEAVEALYRRFWEDWAETDWLLQDNPHAKPGAEDFDARRDFGWYFEPGRDAAFERTMIRRALDELAASGRPDEALATRLSALEKAPPSPDDPAWLGLYVDACRARRAVRLKALAERAPRIIFTRHATMGGSHYAYTEGQSDAQAERHFVPGAALAVLAWDGKDYAAETLLDDAGGVIRDPDVSYDGRRVVFAWKKSDREDDYHLYEMDVATRKVRQLTHGLGVVDYEPAYLPDGDIIFNSTRCVQIVDCWWTEVSNLYRIDKDGAFLRRLTFDQVHDNYPAVTDDGRILYTRWEYNDRGQVFTQPLLQMNPDGTNQAEFYGGNSWFPTTILHARGVPGSQKVMAIATGHHSRQTGKLIVVDPNRGLQENAGVQLVAPVRETRNVRIDAYGQNGDLFQYPYPLSQTDLLVTYHPVGWRWADGPRGPRFGVYWMDISGRRERLALDVKLPSNQPIPLRARSVGRPRPSTVDYAQTHGTFYIQDVYAGPGLAGVPRGTVRTLRVVALDFRPAGIGSNGNGGPGGGAMISTPVAIGNGAWDPKIILGDAPVRDDGSVYVRVPARTPVYFQLLDERGRMVQTMRSWTTLQPGENASCVGCHETKHMPPLAGAARPAALDGPPQDLRPFYGPPRGLSFRRDVQPILDKHCTRCHGGQDAKRPLLTDAGVDDARAKRRWSQAYLTLTHARPDDKGNPPGGWRGDPNHPVVNWMSAQSAPPMQPPDAVGSRHSRLVAQLDKGHNEVRLSREEMDKLAAWIDLGVPFSADYVEANTWTDDEKAKYAHFLDKRLRLAREEEADIAARLGAPVAARSVVEDVWPDYRNVALNPNDVQGEAKGYPHASSNSECRGEACFAARNAIDGLTENRGHGPKFPSWGPDKIVDAWWKVEFGRSVQVDRLVLVIRADFPHDSHWKSATVEFSDGSRETISIKKMPKPQTFRFKPRTVVWLKITDLVQDQPLGWCALTEVEVWGRDAAPPAVAEAAP
jgi:hypothetical protein